MTYLFRIKAIVFFIHLSVMVDAQREQPSPVTWSYQVISANISEVVLHIDAQIAPGWHIYSLHLQPGGPIPTRFTFDPHKGYSLVGVMNEEGDAVRYYDKLYEMDITWYANKVGYTQRLIINKPNVSIKGIVEYMVCNEHICIPVEEEFNVELER